jgi:hypothetical protein
MEQDLAGFRTTFLIEDPELGAVLKVTATLAADYQPL